MFTLKLGRGILRLMDEETRSARYTAFICLDGNKIQSFEGSVRDHSS